MPGKPDIKVQLFMFGFLPICLNSHFIADPSL
jgi:hypothetical protein